MLQFFFRSSGVVLVGISGADGGGGGSVVVVGGPALGTEVNAS